MAQILLPRQLSRQFSRQLSKQVSRTSSSAEFFAEFTPNTVCLFQAFGWDSHDVVDGKTFYQRLKELVPLVKSTGFTHVLFPPASSAADSQGFMPMEFYSLDSAYGTVEELEDVLALLHENGLYAIHDVVLHRYMGCQQKQGTIFYDDPEGPFDEDFDWGDWVDDAVVDSQNAGISESEPQLPPSTANIDHSNPVFQNDVKGWLLWLKKDIGFDGWSFDAGKSYDPNKIKMYAQETASDITIGDVWHPMRYNGSTLEYNQDQHRQQLCDWVNLSGRSTAVFDYTTKGILQAAVENTEYWRLKDRDGNPPGLVGWWSEMAITFLENHSTGSIPKLWPFPAWRRALGYVYLLTHPGTPCIVADDFSDPSLQSHIKSLLTIRKQWNIHSVSQISILKGDPDLYIAMIGSKVNTPTFRGIYVKLGPSFDLRGFQPAPGFQVGLSGDDFCIWEREKD
ncbi:unnamed protein product [Calypogeia fissa]